MTSQPTLLKTPRGTVECARWGEGPAVLLLHGAMGGYDQGILLARAAMGSPAFQFVAVSRPGYLGTRLSVGRSPEEQADVCAGVLDALTIPNVAIVAISGGGPCALQFALRHAARCRALIMISACSAQLKEHVPLRFHLVRLMAHFPAFAESMRKKAARDPERAARRSISDPVLLARTLADPESGPLLRELQLSTFTRMAARIPGTLNDIQQSHLQMGYPLEQIAAPVLIVHGTKDQIVPFEQADLLAHTLPRAELLAIDGGEHVSLFTHRALIQRRITQFLEVHLGVKAAPAVAAPG